MIFKRMPMPSVEELEGRKRELARRTWRWSSIGAGLTVLGIGGVLLAQWAGVAWLMLCLAGLLCLCWAWALVALFLGWGGLWLGLIAAQMAEVASAARIRIEAETGYREGEGLD